MAVNFLYLWNGDQKRKTLRITDIEMIERRCWKEQQNPIVTIQYEERHGGTRTTCLNCSYLIASNNLILSLKHNDKQMATAILTIVNNDFDIVTRVGHFMTNGEFNEMFYEDSNIVDSQAKFVWGAEEYPMNLFYECCCL